MRSAGGGRAVLERLWWVLPKEEGALEDSEGPRYRT